MTDFLGIDHVPFNYRLREARERLGWSRKQLATSSGVNNGSIGAYEALKTWPPPAIQAKIADVLQDAAEYLFPPEVGVALKGHSVRTLTSVLPFESLSLDAETFPELVGGDPAEESTSELRDSVQGLVASLRSRERDVLTRRYGLNGDSPMTLAAIADEDGVTPERIRQIETKALRMMRHPMRSRHLVAFLDRDA